jgi:hypothetical protein
MDRDVLQPVRSKNPYISVHKSYESVYTPNPIACCRENKVATRKRGKAKTRETASGSKKREEQERLDTEEAADYQRVWDLGFPSRSAVRPRPVPINRAAPATPFPVRRHAA